MYEQVLAWAALAVLALLCLPFPGLQKLILTVTAWGLRLLLLALLVGAGYLWFYPEQLPREVSGELTYYPRLSANLPSPRSPYFGVCLAGPVVAALLPVLAVLDVCRK